jgi:hypothetical protein
MLAIVSFLACLYCYGPSVSSLACVQRHPNRGLCLATTFTFARNIHESSEGRTEEHAVLDDAAKNLSELYDNLKGHSGAASRRLSVPEKQLIRRKSESEAVVTKLREALRKASATGTHNRWQSVYLALKGVLGDKEVANIAKRLDCIRKQIDTALLFSIQHVTSEHSYHHSGNILIP